MAGHDDMLDVAIVGAGPVGALLAILLGQQGRRVEVIERWPDIYDRPRAVTMDHEVARILATLGIDANNDPAIEYHDELYYWRNADGDDLQIVDWKSVSPSGWRVTYWFNQPELEARLLKIAATFDTITIRRGWQAVGLEQDDEGATLSITPTEGEGAAEQRRAKFVVGADGANSFVREAVNIPTVDKGYFFDWLILDMIPNEEYKSTPAQWQLCDPARPTTIVPGGPGRRRWEFMVLPEESSEEIAKPESAWKLLEPWGMRPDNAQLERSAVYRFQARWAEKWRVGRCVIAGDAAHLMPPFAGEGMCAGLRDAVALAWRLNGILDGHFDVDALDSYESERIHHARHYIDFSQELGSIICIADPAEAAARDARMKADLAARNHEPISGDLVHLGAGAWCDDTQAAGELSTQGVVQTPNGTTGRFDQVIGHGWMAVGLDADPATALGQERTALLKSLGGRTVHLGPQGADGSHFDGVDIEGTYGTWLNEIGARYFIIRPDFYVAASAATGTDLAQRFDQVMDRLSLAKREEALA